MSILNKKNIIVTGATGGIGSSIVKKLSEAGANILATGTKVNKLEEIKKNLAILEYYHLIFLKMIKLKTLLSKHLKNLGGI